VPLDLSPLKNALAALERSMAYLASDLAKDAGLREQFRGAAIQGFEFTYDIGFKMLKRRLEQLSADPAAIDRLAFKDAIRQAAEAGLVPDPVRFFGYREQRNATSHAYDEAKAAGIEAALPAFRDDMRALVAALERDNHG